MAPHLFLLVSVVIVCLEPCVHASNGTLMDITRSGCGATKFCVEEPEGCDPVTNSSCLFASITAGPVEPPNGVNLSITLTGTSSGYIALGLTANASVGTTMVFVCANMNESFHFLSTEKDNSNADGILSVSNTTVDDIQGQLVGSVIQCSFTFPHVNATALGIGDVTTFVVKLGTGNTNNSVLESFNLERTVGPVNVANLTNNVPPPVNATETPENSTMTPTNGTATPMNSTATPMNSTATPMNSTAVPMINTTMPANVTSSQNTTTTSSTSPLSSSASLLLWSFLSWRAVLLV